MPGRISQQQHQQILTHKTNSRPYLVWRGVRFTTPKIKHTNSICRPVFLILFLAVAIYGIVYCIHIIAKLCYMMGIGFRRRWLRDTHTHIHNINHVICVSGKYKVLWCIMRCLMYVLCTYMCVYICMCVVYTMCLGR